MFSNYTCILGAARPTRGGHSVFIKPNQDKTAPDLYADRTAHAGTALIWHSTSNLAHGRNSCISAPGAASETNHDVEVRGRVVLTSGLSIQWLSLPKL